MRAVGVLVLLCVFVNVNGFHELMCHNVTYDATVRQLVQFKKEHPDPIGLLTTLSGDPVEVRDINMLNSNIASSSYFFDVFTHLVGEKVRERHVHGKGIGVRGYFEVTNDVSKYTRADVFNGIGKRTPMLVRLSHANQERGGTDLGREIRGFAMKFYTDEGNLDILTLHIPIFFTKNPIDFPNQVHAFGTRNPKTNIFNVEEQWDLITLRPWLLHFWLWLNSDFGIPNGFRHMDSFAIHAFEIYNKKGEKYYVRFNFRTEQGLEFLTTPEAQSIQAKDLDYFFRDIYNAVEEKRYPSWRLEMDVIPEHDLKHLDFDPFDMTRLWKNGTYHTVTIGRVVLNEMPDNQFRDSEVAVFNPANLVPGISGPVDVLFQSRRFSYKDSPNFRAGRNHDRIHSNLPKYAKTYNRDGEPPVRENMKDAPTYYPNTFSGPIPYVNEDKPEDLLTVLQSNAVDLQHASDFYNKIITCDAHRQRLADNLVMTLQQVKSPDVMKRALRLLYLTDEDLGKRVESTYNEQSSCRR